MKMPIFERNGVIRLIKQSIPNTCEIWIHYKSGKYKQCQNPIMFITKESGGFICGKCAHRLHKKLYGSIHFYNAEPYLKYLMKQKKENRPY